MHRLFHRALRPHLFLRRPRTEQARGYLRHLVKSEEILGLRLITLHNLHFYLNLMAQTRAHLEAGTFAEFRREFVGNYRAHNLPDDGAATASV